MSYSSEIENTKLRSRASAWTILSSVTPSAFAYSGATSSSDEEISESVTLWPSFASSTAEIGSEPVMEKNGQIDVPYRPVPPPISAT